MRRYLSTTVGGIVHLGVPVYDDDLGSYDPPEQTMCGVPSSHWSKGFVRATNWANRKVGSVCPTCDRTAMWESIVSLGIK